MKLKFKKNDINNMPKRFESTGWKTEDLPTSINFAEYIIQNSLRVFEFKKTKWKGHPHEYIIFDDNTALFFVCMDLLIHAKGYDKIFRIFKTKKMYIYYNFGKYRYWICHDVCNRALIKSTGL